MQPGVTVWCECRLGPCSNPEQFLFPALPEAAPLTYTLLLKACLSPTPKDRPSFKHMQQIFADMRKEMTHDHYVDSTGSVQARPLYLSACSCMHA